MRQPTPTPLPTSLSVHLHKCWTGSLLPLPARSHGPCTQLLSRGQDEEVSGHALRLLDLTVRGGVPTTFPGSPSAVAMSGDGARLATFGYALADVEGDALRALIASLHKANVLLSKAADGRFVSYFGDVHPSYFGNVVKAIGSAKQGHPVVSRALETLQPASALSDEALRLGLMKPSPSREIMIMPTSDQKVVLTSAWHISAKPAEKSSRPPKTTVRRRRRPDCATTTTSPASGMPATL